MGDKSSIEWLAGGATWNPIRARRKSDGKVGWHCVRVSPGCGDGSGGGCYAEDQNVRCGNNPGRAGTGAHYNVPGLDQVELFLDEDTLLQPLSWKKQRLIFPCSMTDWMADFVKDEWRDLVVAVMNLTLQHTYLTLTKRADRQLEYFSHPKRLEFLASAENFKPAGSRDNLVTIAAKKNSRVKLQRTSVAAANQWRGVSTENQEWANKRIPLLLQTPAALRWISVGPQLGPIKLLPSWTSGYDYKGGYKVNAARLDWVISEGESGSKARLFDIWWARLLRDQCAAAGVPFFMKQIGDFPVSSSPESHPDWAPLFHDRFGRKPTNEYAPTRKARKGGDPELWPEDLCVRQYPRTELIPSEAH